MGHSVERKDPFIVRLLGVLILLGLLLLGVIYWPDIRDFANSSLDLSDWDLTMIPVGAFVFFVFWKSMDKYVVSRFLELHLARESATSGAVDLAKKVAEETIRINEQYHEALNTARQQAVRGKLKAIEASRQSGAERVALAEDKSSRIVKETRELIQKETLRLSADLSGQIEVLAGEISSRVKETPRLVG